MRIYLLLQADDAGPLLLQQPLVLFPRGLVEVVGDVGLFPEGVGRLGGIDDAQIGHDGLVPGVLSVGGVASVQRAGATLTAPRPGGP